MESLESKISKVVANMKEQAKGLSTQSLKDTPRLAPSQVATILRKFALELEDLL